MRRASYFRECQLVFRCYVTQRAKLIKATGNFQESLWNRRRGAAFFLHKDYKRIPPDDNRKSFSQFRIGRTPVVSCVCALYALVLPFRADDRSASHRIDLSIRGARARARPPLIHSGTRRIGLPRLENPSHLARDNREKRRCIFTEIDQQAAFRLDRCVLFKLRARVISYSPWIGKSMPRTNQKYICLCARSDRHSRQRPPIIIGLLNNERERYVLFLSILLYELNWLPIPYSGKI